MTTPRAGGGLVESSGASDQDSGKVEEGEAGGGHREEEEKIGEEAAEDPRAPDKPRPPPVHTRPGCPCSALPPPSFPWGLPSSPASSLHSWRAAGTALRPEDRGARDDMAVALLDNERRLV